MLRWRYGLLGGAACMGGDNNPISRSSLWRALQQLTNDAGYYREDLLEALNGELSDKWNIDTHWTDEAEKVATLNRARNHIFSELQFHIAKLKRPHRVPRSKYFHAVYVEFNVPNEQIKADLSKKDLTGRRRWLEREAPTALRVSPSTSQRYIAHAITQIEQQILSAGGEHSIAVVEPPNGSPRDSLYVVRDSLHVEFARLVDNGAKLIVIHGFAGMGKTSLATTLVEGSPVIGMTNGVISSADLNAAIASCQVDMQAFPDDLVGRLAALLCCAGGPTRIVLDGLESADDLVGIIPQSTQATVIATCRHKGDLLSERASFMKVSKMNSDEAMRMIQKRLPESNHDEVQQLAKSLDNYPLAVRYACSLIHEQSLPVGDFCRDIALELAETARHIHTSDRSTLLAVVGRVINQIRSLDALAGKLLAFIASFDGLLVARSTIWSLAQNWSLRYNHRELTPTAFVQSMTLLERYGIIDHFAKPRREVVFASGMSRVHALTSRLIHEQFMGHDVNEVAVCLVQFGMHSMMSQFRDTVNLAANEEIRASHLSKFTDAMNLVASETTEANETLNSEITRMEKKLDAGTVAIHDIEELHNRRMDVNSSPLVQASLVCQQALRLCGNLMIDRTRFKAAVINNFEADWILIPFLVVGLKAVEGDATGEDIPEHWFTWLRESGF
jgi:hypothetical protein